MAASNIFFRPSIPDMASTFFLQSPTSTGRSCGGHTHQRLSVGWGQPSLHAQEALVRGGQPLPQWDPCLSSPRSGPLGLPQAPRGSGTFCLLAGLLGWGALLRLHGVKSGSDLLRILLLHRLEVGTQVHGHLVFRAQQGTQHGISRDADTPQGRALELPAQIQHLELQVLDLQGGGDSRLQVSARAPSSPSSRPDSQGHPDPPSPRKQRPLFYSTGAG